MAKETSIPALRFPEFKGEWAKRSLGHISQDVMYGMNAAAKEFDGKNKYIRITDIDDTSRLFNFTSLTSPDGELADRYLLKDGDLLFARTGASVGKSYIYRKQDGRVYFAGFLIKFHIKKKEADPYFVFSATMKTQYDNWVMKMSMRSGQPGINAEEYKTFELSVPSIQEQRKIALFLFSVDERLQQLQQQQSLLEAYRTGCMQQMFSGKLRFRDGKGKSYPDWKEEALGATVEINKGQQFNRDKLSETGQYPCINGGIEPSGFSELYNREANTITISEGGNSCGYVNLIGSRFWSGGHCYTVDKSDAKKLDRHFLYHLLKFNESRIMALRVGSGLPNIQKSTLLGFRISFPASLEEQGKIAAFLSALTKQVNAVKQQIAQTKQFKKGLLQLLFA